MFDNVHIEERLALQRWLTSKQPVTFKEVDGVIMLEDERSNDNSREIIDVTLDITLHFVRKLPASPKYAERLAAELELIRKNNFEPIFLQVVTILNHTQHIPHLVRGSAAGSLVSWMLGITCIDPIEHKMSLERFMNHKRINKPDIDLDFPQHKRNEVLQIIHKLYPNQVGRVCNHVMWRESSAFQEAVRRTKGIVNDYTQDVVRSLVGTHRYDSLHCGGVVVFPSTVPKHLVTKDNRLVYNKQEVETAGLVKIDVLSNRGLSILDMLQQNCKTPYKNITDYPCNDDKIAEMLAKADVVGVTYCETPVMMKIIRCILPKTPIELSLCLALVRPAPDKKMVKQRLAQGCKNLLVYDDDIIEYIASLLDTDLAEGETIRKGLAKNNSEVWKKFKERLLSKFGTARVTSILVNFANISKYSFCKSHSMNYAYMCWALLWYKAHHPGQFWRAVLTHAKSQYANWVYVRHAISQGFTVELTNKLDHREWYVDEARKHLYCTQNSTQQELTTWFSPEDCIDLTAQSLRQLKEFGYWNGPWLAGFRLHFNKPTDRFCTFKGLIACSREYKLIDNTILSFVTIGVADGVYYNLTIKGRLPSKSCIISGKCKVVSAYELTADQWSASTV